jgi:hypothetical protein
MKPLLYIAVIFVGHICYGQQMLRPPTEYYSNLAIADSLSEQKEYVKATHHFNLAFESFDWRGTPADRFKAAKIFALANNFDSAFKNIERLWKQQYINYLKITTDPTFHSVRQIDPLRFDTLIRHIQSNKVKHAPKQNLVWTNYLDSIYEADQVIRKKFMRAAKFFGWDSPEAKEVLPEMRLSDSLNLISITKFIDNYGWQGQEEIGHQGNATLFLVIQHSDSATQEKYIPLLKKAVKQRKARPEDLALMEDRLSMSKFGFQFMEAKLSKTQLQER